MSPRSRRLPGWFAAALVLGAADFALASDDPAERFLPDPNKAGVDGPPAQAHVHGKYRTLLRRIYVPQDKQSYGLFTDWGMYNGNSWAGFNDLPPGHWVYVYPHWYIWRDCVRPGPGAGQGAAQGVVRPIEFAPLPPQQK